MKCQACGATNPDDATFCSLCFAFFKKQEATAPQPAARPKLESSAPNLLDSKSLNLGWVKYVVLILLAAFGYTLYRFLNPKNFINLGNQVGVNVAVKEIPAQRMPVGAITEDDLKPDKNAFKSSN